ncbi:MAG: hypothetical protein NTZ86_08075, partial [Legionellales bacterium]|nr:hypothetical protein [Legionellales bacterium]
GYLIPIYKATYGGLVPVKPWTPLSTINDKIEKLIDIANRGVLLIDLFPFAIKYTTALRKTLARHNVTADFFDNIANPYNINARLIGLIGLKTKPQIALVAPPKISHDIANRINIGGIAIALGFTIRAVHNFVTPPIMLIIKDEFYIWPPGTHLSGLYPWRVKPKMFPIFRCCCYSGAKTVPHQLFITNAFI